MLLYKKNPREHRPTRRLFIGKETLRPLLENVRLPRLNEHRGTVISLIQRVDRSSAVRGKIL